MASDLTDLLVPILENSKVAITLVDPSGQLTLFNRAAEILTGYSRDEVLGRQVSLFYESEEESQEIARRVSEQGKLEDYQTTLVGKDGRRVPISILVTALYDSEGRPVGSLGITVDVSLRKKLEEDLLREKQRVLFYNDLLCHDIRNFTQTALGLFDLLDGEGVLDDGQRRLLQMCQRQSRRTRDLINRVRTLAQLEDEGGEVSVPMPLSPALSEAIGGLYESFPDRSITVHSPAAKDLFVSASPLLPELLYNLFSNGVAHNPSTRPTLWIRLAETQRDGKPFVDVAVEDDGPGIPDERKRWVFERYSRMDKRGSGIGLSLVKALTHQYGGTVWAEDRVVNDWSQGVRFVAALPQVEP